MEIITGQDSDIINNEISKFKLNDSDKRYSKKDKNFKLDFVGFCIQNNKILAVFPKHFYDDIDINNLSNKDKEEDIELLFKVINKYNREYVNKHKADKFLGDKDNFISDYPFDDFYSIYEYYKENGIYKETENIIKPNLKGKISWKTTIQKSNILVYNDSFAFMPYYSKNKNYKNVFISECMIFVINYTIKNFQFFMDLPLIQGNSNNFNFLSNREFTIRELYKYKSSIFKDRERKLINSLISFFENFDKTCFSGNIHLKINYFNRIWEIMVNKYLNEHFIKIDMENKKIIFGKRDKKLKFESYIFNDIDLSENHFQIIPDHYLQDNENIYVFDSKYYEKLDDLNYKQFTYTLLLGNSQLGRDKNIYSSLLLPGKNKSKLHLNLNVPYQQMKNGCNFIIEQYLDVKTLMKNYLLN